MTDCIDLSNYEQLELIGEGHHGKVFKIREKKSGELFAAKITSKESDFNNSQDLLSIKRESREMLKLNHPCVLQFHGFSTQTFSGESKPVIITELASRHSIQHQISIERISPASQWDDTKKLICIYGIASGMKYLHSNQIIHRDLNPDNILLTDQFLPKITNFGLLKQIHTTREHFSTESENEFQGTENYCSPEIILANFYSKATDVYAFGMTVYAILTSTIPFEGLSSDDLQRNVLNEERPEILQYSMNSEYVTLIQQCWSQNQNERPSFDEIVNKLETNRGFLTAFVDEDEYFKYVKYVKEYSTTIDPSKRAALSKLFLGNQSLQNEASINSQSLSPSEKNELGENYLNGKGVSKNLKEAVRLFREASESGDKRALYNLGMCNLNGWGVPFDLYEAARLFKSASESGVTDAMLELGNLYFYGLGVKEDKAEAVRLYRLGYTQGNLDCQQRLGCCHCDGDGVEKNQEEAFNILSNAVKKNHARSMVSLGFMYYNGLYVKKDLSKYLELTRCAAKNGISTAINNLAINYLEGEGVPKDPEEALKLLRKASKIPDRGGILACRNLASRYKDGNVLPQDHNEAMHYYRLAASYNDIQTINEIDIELPSNINPVEDKKKAISDIQRGYEAGNLYYTVSLGMCYEYGDGIAKDLSKAYDIYKQAVKAGSQRAMYRLGLFYEEGIIVKKDIEEALRLYQKSSDWGYSLSTFRLALIYTRGLGVPVDKAKALPFWSIAFDRPYNSIYDGEKDFRYDMAVIADTEAS